MPEVPMNSVDYCDQQRAERLQEGTGPQPVRSDLICDSILHTVPVVQNVLYFLTILEIREIIKLMCVMMPQKQRMMALTTTSTDR